MTPLCKCGCGRYVGYVHVPGHALLSKEYVVKQVKVNKDNITLAEEHICQGCWEWAHAVIHGGAK